MVQIDAPKLPQFIRTFNELANSQQMVTEKLREATLLLDRAATTRAPGSIGATIAAGPVVSEGGAKYAGHLIVTHPGAAPMEFGRQRYYAGYRGRRQKSGSKVTRRGQKARPYIGVKQGTAAVAEVQPKMLELFEAAYVEKWEQGTA